MNFKNQKSLILIIAFLGGFAANAQTVQKVGNNSMTISPSAAFEVESTTKGFLLPRMTSVQMNAIASPADGLLLYCTTCTPAGVYINISSAWSALSAATSSSSVIADGTTKGFEGYYTAAAAVNANNKYAVTVTNNSFSTVTLSFAAADVVLSGTGIGTATAGAPTPSTVTLTAGQSQSVEYALSGTPVAGSLTAKWTKLALTATQTITVPSFATNFSASTGSFNGSYVSGSALNSANTIAVYFTNNKAESTTVSFATANLVLSGIAGLTVSAVSPASATIATGATSIVTYSLSGTPASTGTLTANFNNNGVTATNSRTVSNGDATFSTLPLDNSVVSIDNGGSGDTQGIIDNGTNKVTYTIPYTGGLGAYTAYTSAAVAVTGQAGDANNLTLTYPAGTFSTSGNITATVVVDGDGIFNVTKLAPGVVSLIGTLPFAVNSAAKGNVTITAVTYVTSPTGRKWMAKNLGAASVSSSLTDANSYGDLYQWGRGADGHQLRTSSTTATLSSIDQPGNANFIITPNSPYNWRSPQNDNLWQGVNGINNPCPTGYRLPTLAELSLEVAAFSSADAAGAFASVLKLSLGGMHSETDGSLLYVGSGGLGLYWSSTVSGTDASYMYIISNNASTTSYHRGRGYSIRCTKD